ncbi:hypothetical protein FSARC_6320 [Fusarium sarcochroum]|uniref:Uncharacterized protein n=1 Tax=Fusarium sarcochroum TaxID=1208366 RepID=A0A8H4TXR9_9HYPO|nr:hypothetical protein FSARC_6320 [Fusarium sarcochroum]
MSSIIGPFPTKYSPGRDCAAVTSNSVIGIDFATSCLPDDFDPAPSAYYSPGIACPSGYSAQKSCTRSSGSGDKTTVTCCPQRSDIDMWCVEDPGTLSGVWESLFCTWSAGNQEKVVLITTDINGTDSATTVTMSGAEGINAFGLRMVYEPTDIPNTDASTTDASTSGATNEPAQTSFEDGGNGAGISTGGIIAIAVVIPVVIIAALIGAFIWWRRRKHRSTPGILAEYTDAPKELPPSQGVNELYGSQAAQELPAISTFVSELPGDFPMGAATSTATSPPGFSKTDAVSPGLTSNDEISPALSPLSVGRSITPSPAEDATGRQS